MGWIRAGSIPAPAPSRQPRWRKRWCVSQKGGQCDRAGDRPRGDAARPAAIPRGRAPHRKLHRQSVRVGRGRGRRSTAVLRLGLFPRVGVLRAGAAAAGANPLHRPTPRRPPCAQAMARVAELDARENELKEKLERANARLAEVQQVCSTAARERASSGAPLASPRAAVRPGAGRPQGVGKDARAAGRERARADFVGARGRCRRFPPSRTCARALTPRAASIGVAALHI